MRSTRFRAALLGGVTLAALLGTATPAHATDEFPNKGHAEVDLLCTSYESQVATWRFQVTNSYQSFSPMHFVVGVDGTVVFDGYVEVGESTGALESPGGEDTPTTITIVGDGEVITTLTDSISCQRELDGDVTFECGPEGGVVHYSMSVAGSDEPVEFHYVEPDGTLSFTEVANDSTTSFDLAVAEDADYHVAVGVGLGNFEELAGVADCEAPVTTTTQPEEPTTTTEPEVEVLTETLTAPAAPSLPRTGTTSGPLAIAGVGSLLAGTALLAAARRRAVR